MKKLLLLLLILGASCEKEEVIEECNCEVTEIIGSYPSLIHSNCGFLDTNSLIEIGDCVERAHVIK